MTKKPKEHDVQKELQAKYIQYQVLRQQLSAFTEEKAMLDSRVNEFNITIDSLHKLEDVKKGNEMWSQIGSGAFVRSDIKDIDMVLISIGAGLVVKESRERSIEILQGRMEEMNSLQLEMLKEITSISQMLEKLEPELEALAHTAKNE